MRPTARTWLARGLLAAILLACLAAVALQKPPAPPDWVLFEGVKALQVQGRLQPDQVAMLVDLLHRWLPLANEHDNLLRLAGGPEERLLTPEQLAWILARPAVARRPDLPRVLAMLEERAGADAAGDLPFQVFGPTAAARGPEALVGDVLAMEGEPGLALTPEQARTMLPLIRRWADLRDRMDPLTARMREVLTPEQREGLAERARLQPTRPDDTCDLERGKDTLDTLTRKRPRR